jgi:ribonuclease HII
MKYIVGVDEVGRGPIAGPVTVCVFIVQADYDILKHFKNRKLRDSKKLSDTERNRIRTELNKAKLAGYIDFAIVSKSAEYIDKNGISKAVSVSIEEGMQKLLRLHYNLDKSNTKIELDGALNLTSKFIQKVHSKYGQQLGYTVNIKGDEKIPAVAAASILAKVVRDNRMIYLSKKLYDIEGKWYNWSSNVGYGTKEHFDLIHKHGITEYHRKSFLKKIIESRN